MKKIAAIIFVLNFLAEIQAGEVVLPEESCSRNQAGGFIEEDPLTSKLVFHSPEMKNQSEVLDQKDIKKFGPYEFISGLEGEQFLYNITGESAKKLFTQLVLYFVDEDPLSCRLLDYRGGVIFAKGLSCHHGHFIKEEGDFICSLIVVGRDTFSGPLALPRPRMGAGNARVMLERLNKN